MAAEPVGKAFLAPPKLALRVKNIEISPRLSYSGRTGPAAGIRAYSVPHGDLGPGFTSSMTVSWYETIKLDLRQQWGTPDRGMRVRIDERFRYSPNERFYGIGNEVSEIRGIYLRQEGRAAGTVSFGEEDREIRGTAGLSIVEVRRGYHGSPDLEDVFDADALGFPRHETVAFLGGGGTLRSLDDTRLPSRGISLSADLQRARSTDSTHLRYWEGSLEAVGYLPVFARRRVLIARSAYRFTDPSDDSDPIPFYRLPDSADPTRFSGYSTHRFRDQHLALSQVEYRWEILQSLWALGFAQVGTVAPSRESLRIAGVRESYGGGLRLAMGRDTVARLVAARGREALRFYLTLNETF